MELYSSMNHIIMFNIFVFNKWQQSGIELAQLVKLIYKRFGFIRSGHSRIGNWN